MIRCTVHKISPQLWKIVTLHHFYEKSTSCNMHISWEWYILPFWENMTEHLQKTMRSFYAKKSRCYIFMIWLWLPKNVHFKEWYQWWYPQRVLWKKEMLFHTTILPIHAYVLLSFLSSVVIVPIPPVSSVLSTYHHFS